ncbi:MAG: hypothetical protein DIU68_013045 [Chloroflexota bacterium]
MEIIRGKHASFIDTRALAGRIAGYDRVHLDIGTGDGRYVRHLALANPRCFVIGLDAARENLAATSRRAPENALFVIANALCLPRGLHGLAASITINFPWGSLLRGLLDDDPALLHGLTAVARPGAGLDIRLNAGALAEAGWTLEAGAERVRRALVYSGFDVRAVARLSAAELKALPATWAKRLAFGRDPRAVYLGATLAAQQIAMPA